ncbi:E2F Family [Parasponia andersonii]|uniref:E2F Family n=1 Tax=Parasponia andersonii TaxID=3476 RepID=A0A2P5BFM2_PARAD|nr:E2F Family [Parasponia andersonii]
MYCISISVLVTITLASLVSLVPRPFIAVCKTCNVAELKQKQVKQESFVHESDGSILEEDSKDNLRSYQFGPIAPITIPRVGASENNNLKRVHDWESLASTYHPQYQNQGILSGLLGDKLKLN